MPDRPDNHINDAPPGASSGSGRRVDNIPTHQHLDTDALSAFIDNRLDGDLSLAAAGHIATCTDCRRELAELRATVSLLNGLPQYRPRRSFALSQDYAHPVRTSFFARFLPLLPRLQAATVACLLLLLVVGAGDVLTEIGEDSNNSANLSSEPEQTGGDTAFQSDPAAGGANQPGPGAVTGDGTGGESGSAGFAEGAGSKPGADTGIVDQSEETAADNSVPADDAPAGDAPSAAFSEAPPAEDEAADTANDSDSISAASAPEDAESATDSDSDTSGAEEESLGESAEADLDVASDSVDDGNAADSAVAGGGNAAREPAADAAGAPPPDAANDESSSDADQSSAGLTAPTVGAESTEPVPTIGISTEATEDGSEEDVAQADASGSAAPERQSGSVSDSGISNWRLTEIVLGIVLVLLGALVVVLHRLNARARRIGIIR